MRLDDRFGDFLLFRQLGSTALGSTFRAGRLQARAIDRVVLLQRFDGDGIDRERLAAGAAERGDVIGQLTTPHFAHGLAMGTEDGVPFVAYDYLLGRTLEETLRRAARKGRPPEPSYLVALIEQAAASLATAAQSRIAGLPIRHGFLVPELMLLSAEGRVYPLGFSHGAALLRQEPLVSRFSAYLAPEARSGELPGGDDVYSLTAILFEGLTGAPPDPEQPTATQVDQALLGVTGAPFSPAVQDLLKSGLAPADARPDLESFHRSLRRVIEDSEDSPTQFQLAFFLHQLFRDELETEAVEMRSEKTARFDPLALTPPELPASPEPTREASGGSAGGDKADEELEPIETVPVQIAPPPAAAPPRFSQRPFLTGLAVALTLAALTAGTLHLTRRSPAAAAEEDARGGDALAAQTDTELRRLVTARAADLTSRLEDEYEPRLARLREDVLAARTARQKPKGPARLEAAVATDPEPAAISPNAEPAAEPSREDALTDVIAENPAQTIAGASREAAGDGAGDAEPDLELAVDRLAQLPPPSAVAPTSSSPPPSPGAPDPPRDGAPQEKVGETAEPAAPASAAADPATQTEPVSAEPASFAPPRLLEPPEPRYPAVAQRLGKTGRVQVRVRVDTEGRVGETEVLSGETRFGFDKAALQAARKTRWQPASQGGQPTSAWAVLTIDFRL